MGASDAQQFPKHRLVEKTVHAKLNVALVLG
jgi:hypothetical protein